MKKVTFTPEQIRSFVKKGIEEKESSYLLELYYAVIGKETFKTLQSVNHFPECNERTASFIFDCIDDYAPEPKKLAMKWLYVNKGFSINNNLPDYTIAYKPEEMIFNNEMKEK